MMPLREIEEELRGHLDQVPSIHGHAVSLQAARMEGREQGFDGVWTDAQEARGYIACIVILENVRRAHQRENHLHELHGEIPFDDQDQT